MYTISMKKKIFSLSMLLLCGSLQAMQGGGTPGNNAAAAAANGNSNGGFGAGMGNMFEGMLTPLQGYVDKAKGLAQNTGISGAAAWVGTHAMNGILAANKAIQDAAEANRQKRDAELNRLYTIVNNPGRYSDREVALATHQVTILEKEANDEYLRMKSLQDEAAAMPARFVNETFEGLREAARQEQLGKQKLQEVAVNAESRKEEAVEKAKLVIAAATDKENIKKFVIAGSAIILSYYTIKYGSMLAHDAIKHYYRNPTISTDTTLVNPLEAAKQKVINRITGRVANKASVKDVILEPELAKRIEVLDKSIQNTVKNGAPFGNILFYGPPGTGKTMLAKRLALSSGLEYIYFSASALEQLSLEEGLIKLTELFEFAKKSSKKLMIVIDEAEKLFANRDHQISDKTSKLFTHVLSYTGTESYDFMVVALTNRPQDLDKAFLSRCDDKIKIDVPGFEQRRALIRKYFTDYLITAAKPLPVAKGSMDNFVKWLENKPQPARRITIDKTVLSVNFINELTQKTDGFVGRDIAKMFIAILKATYVSDDAHVTPELVNHIVAIKVAEHATA